MPTVYTCQYVNVRPTIRCVLMKQIHLPFQTLNRCAGSAAASRTTRTSCDVMRHTVIEHRFVEHFPEALDPGVLYVSLQVGSIAHSYGSGCGEEVVTPLTPTDWNVTYDGEAIPLLPSDGSWTPPCRSLYIIRRGQVVEAHASPRRLAFAVALSTDLGVPPAKRLDPTLLQGRMAGLRITTFFLERPTRAHC